MSKMSLDRIEQKAMLQGWPEPSAEKKAAMIERQYEIALDEKSPRESTRAFLALLSVSRHNLDVPDEDETILEGHVVELRTPVDLNGDATVEAFNAASGMSHEALTEDNVRDHSTKANASE